MFGRSCLISGAGRVVRVGKAFRVAEGGGDLVAGLVGDAVDEFLLERPRSPLRCLQFGSLQVLCFFSFVLEALFRVLLEVAELAAVTSELAAVIVLSTTLLTLFSESALTLVTCVRLEYPESLCRSGIGLEDGETADIVSLLSLPKSPERFTEILACFRDSETSPSSEL
jgi:hypothetical protein